MEEEDEFHQGGGQLCKFPRVDNEELEEHGGGGGGGRREGLGGFNSSNWHHSSRIIRVSRASGGKDRHSKVMTSKGLRDRRVRLSVTTAIQFYDLQDRLGYDQPSKAVEWLIKSASDAISELPSLNNTFPDTPKQPSDEKRVFDSADAEVENNNIANASYQQNQNLSLSKSGCSSNSETSKGSGLSLARSDIRGNRVKARERARTRTAKEKEKEVNEQQQQQQPTQSHNNNNNVPHQTASFTELLTGGMNNTNSPRGSVHHHHNHQGNNNENEARQQWSSAPMDYFSPMLLGTSSRTTHQNSSTGFSLLSLPEHQAMSLSPFSNNGENHYSFIPHDNQHHLNLMPAVVTSSSMNEYNLNFTVSSSSSSSQGLVGYNRGTLQSNSPSLLPHQLQRFSSIDGSSSSSSSTLPFFMGHGVAAQHAPSTNTMENSNQHHHQFSSPFDSNRLHLCYGDACRHSDQKGKPKN